MSDRYVNQKYNPIFSAIVIDKIYKFCKDNGYDMHTYNAEYDDVWFVATKKDGTKLMFTMDSKSYQISLKGTR